MHLTRTISCCCYFIGIKLSPPVLWCRHISLNMDHPHEFPIGRTCFNKILTELHVSLPYLQESTTKVACAHKVASFFTKAIICGYARIMAKLAITLIPGVHRVSHTANCTTPPHRLYIFNLYHFFSASLTSLKKVCLSSCLYSSQFII